jgi:hypothetical protein
VGPGSYNLGQAVQVVGGSHLNGRKADGRRRSFDETVHAKL